MTRLTASAWAWSAPFMSLSSSTHLHLSKSAARSLLLRSFSLFFSFALSFSAAALEEKEVGGMCDILRLVVAVGGSRAEGEESALSLLGRSLGRRAADVVEEKGDGEHEEDEVLVSSEASFSFSGRGTQSKSSYKRRVSLFSSAGGARYLSAREGGMVICSTRERFSFRITSLLLAAATSRAKTWSRSGPFQFDEEEDKDEANMSGMMSCSSSHRNALSSSSSPRVRRMSHCKNASAKKVLVWTGACSMKRA